MIKFKSVFLVLIFFLISSNTFALFGPPKIDATTEESFKKTFSKVQESLPEEQQLEFLKAAQLLMFKNLDLKNIFKQSSNSTEEFSQNQMAKNLDGKTGLEIIAAAKIIEEQEQVEKRANALKEIEDLEVRKKAAQDARLELIKVKVLSSKFYKINQEYGRPKPVIKLTVFNGTKIPISRIYFSATLKSKNRTVPWLKEDFNYEISGGIEPAETLTWTLAPNSFSKWGTVEAPPDADLILQVIQLDDPQGEPICSTNQFTQEDQRKLDQLKKTYNIED